MSSTEPQTPGAMPATGGVTPPSPASVVIQPNSTATVAATTQTADESADEQTLPETVKALLTKLRQQNRELSSQAKAGKTAQERLAEIEEASKSELQKAQERATALEAQIGSMAQRVEQTAVSAALAAAAIAAGFVDSADALALVNREAVEYDAAVGQVKGADQAIADLAKAKPHLLKPQGQASRVPATAAPQTNAPARPSDQELHAARLRASGAYRL